MRTAIALLCCLCALTFSYAQEKRPTLYEWQPKQLNADSYFVDGVEVKALYGEGVVVSVALMEDVGKYTQFMVGVKNLGEERVLVSPHMAKLAISEPKREELWSELDEEVARSLEKGGRWRDFFSAFAAGMATRRGRVTVTGEDGDRTEATVTTPDYAAQREAREARERRRQQRKGEAGIVREFSLKKNTLFAGDEVVGCVFFKRKEFSRATLTLVVGGNVYVFPVR